ncbi:HD-GYP domain-containing protein [Nanoarchaeota archaeon]
MEPNDRKHLEVQTSFLLEKFIELAEDKRRQYIPTKDCVFRGWHMILYGLEVLNELGENGVVVPMEKKIEYLATQTRYLKNFIEQESRDALDIGLGRTLSLLEMEISLKDQSLQKRECCILSHSRNVSEYAVALGREYGLSKEEIDTLRITGLVHDVGKIAIPDIILAKPGRLLDVERDVIQQHSYLGEQIVRSIGEICQVEGMQVLRPGVISHHERFDGKGYPNNLSGEKIPLQARILAAADAFDAMTFGRQYQALKSPYEGIREIHAKAGEQFDPGVARVANKALLPAFERLRKKSA